jgi:RNA polymerase sigma-70 factor (ECF subfamily)
MVARSSLAFGELGEVIPGGVNNFPAEIDEVIRASLASHALQDADREDCVQETWLAILGSRMSGFRGGNLQAWVTTLARNKAIDTIRRSRRPAIVFQEDIPTSPRAASNPDEARQQVWSALAQLEPMVHPRSFLIFFLRWFEGWSFVEIEETLGLTAGQARVQNHRIKRKFRALLETASALTPADKGKIPGTRETIRPAPR